MSLPDIYERLTQVSGRAASAAVTFKSEPLQKPANLPAVWVRWIETNTTSSTHGNTTAVGRNERRGIRRAHSFEVTVLTTSTANTPEERLRALSVADEYMDALDADRTLKGNEAEGVVATANVTRVSPIAEAWDNVVYTGIVARVECIEL